MVYYDDLSPAEPDYVEKVKVEKDYPKENPIQVLLENNSTQKLPVPKLSKPRLPEPQSIQESKEIPINIVKVSPNVVKDGSWNFTVSFYNFY